MYRSGQKPVRLGEVGGKEVGGRRPKKKGKRFLARVCPSVGSLCE